MTRSIICPVCGTKHDKIISFCTECGTNLSELGAVDINITPNLSSDNIQTKVKSQVHNLSQKAHQGLSGVSGVISERAKEVSNRTTNLVIEDKVTEAMGNLVNLMINVSKDLLKQIPEEVVKAVDLEAEINFVAFTIGVNIDLAELQMSKKQSN